MSTNYDGIFLRPNLKNTGTVPASSELDECPDIWIAGKTAIANFQTVLAEKYAESSPQRSRIYRQQTNIIYVRGKNGSNQTKSVNVTLYRAPEHCLNMPSYWQIIKTDQGGTQGNMLNVDPGAVGVCDQPFVLPTDRDGYDDNSLIAQLNDVDNGNPFPPTYTVLNLKSLVQNNLGFGWLDFDAVFDPDDGGLVTWNHTCPLTIPYNLPESHYDVYVAPTGFTGWKVELFASRTDTDGTPIQLAPTTVTKDGEKIGLNGLSLAPGFKALVTISMKPPSSTTPAPPGASAPFFCIRAS